MTGARGAAHKAVCHEEDPHLIVGPQQLLSGYFQAVRTGEMKALMNLLAEDVVLWTDGGGKARTAALRPITGRDAVARFSVGTQRFLPETHHAEIAEVNGQPAIIIHAEGRVFSVLTIEVEAEHIRTIHVIANPEKLTHV